MTARQPADTAQYLLKHFLWCSEPFDKALGNHKKFGLAGLIVVFLFLAKQSAFNVGTHRRSHRKIAIPQHSKSP
jgi:hypothetical protein